MTRFRTDLQHRPLPMAKRYYAERSHTPGTLLITEGVAVSERLVGLPHWAGNWNSDHIAAWADIVEEVHRKGCYIYQQFCCAGRTADKGFAKLSAGDIPLEADSSSISTEDATSPPDPMTEEDIQQAIHDHALAARNAMEAGFDGVELHGANGYLIDQFLQESCNNRVDGYGGTVENRSRFALEITRAVVEAIGAHRVGFRISPWSTYHSITPIRPREQFSHLVLELGKYDLAYLHVVTSRVDNWTDIDRDESLDFVFSSWPSHLPMILTGGYNASTAKNVIEREYPNRKIAVGFGRAFASTPDLVSCIRQDLPPNTFRGEFAYSPGEPRGYIDYPHVSV
jgi:NADPH2 dehydrogenase